MEIEMNLSLPRVGASALIEDYLQGGDYPMVFDRFVIILVRSEGLGANS